MPVLSGETSIFPDDLLESAAAGPSTSSWWVLYTKARQEKAVARHLLAKEIPFYLPQVKRTLCYQRQGTIRRVISHLPLFDGYVFMFGSAEDRLASLQSNRIVRVLHVDDGERLRKDLVNIRRLIASGAPLTPESRLVPGKRVRVRFGALAGLEGTLLKRHGQTLVVVSIDFIQQGASMAIDDAWLELAE